MTVDMDLNALRCCYLFTKLGDTALGKIIELLEERCYNEGDFLFQEGDLGHAFYVVREGAVRIFKKMGAGETIDIAEMGAGEVFGEMALISDQPRTASCVCTSRTRLMRLSRQALEGLETTDVAVYAAIVKSLARIVCSRLNDANAKAANLLRELDSNEKKKVDPSDSLIMSKRRLKNFLKAMDGHTEEAATRTVSEREKFWP